MDLKQKKYERIFNNRVNEYHFFISYFLPREMDDKKIINNYRQEIRRLTLQEVHLKWKANEIFDCDGLTQSLNTCVSLRINKQEL